MEKCKYYWLKPKRVKCKYEFDEGQDKDLRFKVGDSNKKQILTYLSPKEEHKILGIWIAPSGTKKRQVKDMKGKTQRWAKQMDKYGMLAYLKERSYRQQLWTQLSWTIIRH